MGLAYSIVFDIVFFVTFFGIFGVIIFTVIKAFGSAGKSQMRTQGNTAYNDDPTLTVHTYIVGKRCDSGQQYYVNVKGRPETTGYYNNVTPTYYITFRVESGDTMEFPVNDGYYNSLFEGDSGLLTFRGNEFIKFEQDVIY